MSKNIFLRNKIEKLNIWINILIYTIQTLKKRNKQAKKSDYFENKTDAWFLFGGRKSKALQLVAGWESCQHDLSLENAQEIRQIQKDLEPLPCIFKELGNWRRPGDLKVVCSWQMLPVNVMSSCELLYRRSVFHCFRCPWSLLSKSLFTLSVYWNGTFCIFCELLKNQ